MTKYSPKIFKGKSIIEVANKARHFFGVNEEELKIEILSERKVAKNGQWINEMVVKVFTVDDSETALDGMAWLEEGVLKVSNPEGLGRYPTIEVREPLRISIDGANPASGLFVVSEETSVDFRIPVDVEAERNIKIRVRDQGLNAEIKVEEKEGIEYRLVDKKEGHNLILQVAGVSKPLNSLTVEEATKKLVDEGIVFGIDEDSIRKAIEAKDGKWHQVAVGQEPVNGEHGKVNLLYPKEKEEEFSDLLDHRKLDSVAAGEVIAHKIPAVLGQPGIDVSGNEIAPPKVREAILRAGDGVLIHGDKVVAARPGRPEFRGGVLKVFQVFTSYGDVDAKSGHLKYEGDVVIAGNVQDGMRVHASGFIKINGNVYKSDISAGGSVEILGNVVGSHVRAGGETAVYQKILFKIRYLNRQLRDLLSILKNISKADGRALLALVEKNYRNVPRVFAELEKEISEKNHLDTNLTHTILEVSRAFKPNRLVEIKFEEFVELVQELLLQEEEFEELGLRNLSDIRVGSIQNSYLEASGDVLILGKGSFNSYLSGGMRVRVTGKPGIVRGGQVSAGKEVDVNELGSQALSLTQVNVGDEGVIKCRRVYPNVVLRVGRYVKRYEEEKEFLELRKEDF